MSENQQPLDEEQAASAAEKELTSVQAMPAATEEKHSESNTTPANTSAPATSIFRFTDKIMRAPPLFRGARFFAPPHRS